MVKIQKLRSKVSEEGLNFFPPTVQVLDFQDYFSIEEGIFKNGIPSKVMFNVVGIIT